MNQEHKNAAENPPYPPQTPNIGVQKVRYFASRRDMAFAAGYLLISILAANCAGWYGLNLGLGTAMTALLLLTAAYLWPTRRHVGFYGVACFAGALASSVSLFWSGDGTIKRLTVLLALVLATLAVIDLQQLWRRGKGTFRLVADVCRWGIGFPFAHCGDVIYALFHRKLDDGTVKSRRTGSMLLGLLCALPLLVILLPLLIRSDAAFAGMLERVDLGTVIELVFSLVVGLGLFLLLFAQSFMLPRQPSCQPEAANTSTGGIEPVALGAFLAVICGVYVLYLVSQLAYFFSGFAGILPDGFTVAQYARRGFFEMTAVCTINLLLTALSLLVVRKAGGREPLFIRLMALFISLFSLVLVVTAVSKMVLYIQSFGMTRLRILTSVFMLFLAVTFVCVIIRLFASRFGYMKVVLAAGVVLLLTVNFVNCDRLIAEYNYNAWQSGQLKELDVKTIGELGDAAVPILWEIAQSGEENASNQARAYLTCRGDVLLELEWPAYDADTASAPPTVVAWYQDVRAYNRDIVKAKQILYKNWQQIYLDQYWDYLAD